MSVGWEGSVLEWLPEPAKTSKQKAHTKYAMTEITFHGTVNDFDKTNVFILLFAIISR